MKFLINIARAAESQVVSCSGSDCDLCALLETVSNVYNFILVISFAIAVLILIISGAGYLMSGGNRAKTQKSLLFLRNGLIGFSIVLLGWLVVQSVVKMVGYENAGGWWQFQCAEDKGLTDSSQSGSYFPSFYDNLKIYPDLTAFLKSGDEQAKIKGPMEALSLSNQLKGLKNGETLRFLAPVRLGSIDGTKDLFLPMLTVSKNGDSLNLDNTGEYWNLIQNMYPKAKAKISSSSEQQLLDKLLGTDSLTDSQSLIDGAGNSLGGDSDSDFSSLYKTIADTLSSSLEQGDRSQVNDFSENLSDSSLSELIALAGSYNQGDSSNATDQMIGNLTSQVLKMVSTVMVEKGSSVGGILSVDSLCQNPNSGDWIKNGCNKDDDEDDVINGEDRCPNTPGEERSLINRTKGSQYQGCSCSDLGSVEMQCPPDQCVGDNWVSYPIGSQVCEEGKLVTYSCKPVSQEFSPDCFENPELIQSGQENDNSNKLSEGDSTGDPWTSGKDSRSSDPFTSKSDKNNASANGTQKNQSGTSSKASSPTKKAPDRQIIDDRSKPPSNIGSIPPGSGNSGGGPMGNGTPEAIKNALREIDKVDHLRYESVFMYVNRIRNIGFSGGMSAGCTGTIWVSFSLWKDGMEGVIIHETTHNAHACNTSWGWGNSATSERIAVASEMGSLCRKEGHEDMAEFPGQREGKTYMGKEVRGYIARKQTVVSPPGNLGTSAFRGPLAYAFSYGNTTRGPYHYGEDNSGIVLGLTKGEEEVQKMINVLRRQQIKDGKTRCFSKPTADLPPVDLCDKPGIPEIVIK